MGAVSRVHILPSRRRSSRLLHKKATNPPVFDGGSGRAKRGAASGFGIFTCCPEIQSRGRGAKRKKHCLSACSAAPAAAAPSWGAKRARTAAALGGGGGKPAPSSLSVPPRPTITDRCVREFFEPPDPAPLLPGSSGTRDWANLGDGPAGLIADLVLADDVADYVRFRAVCRPWRRCSVDPRCGKQGGGGLDARFLPRKWVMLDKAHAGTRCHRFLNVCTGECIRMDLPELAEHTLLALIPDGLLLLFHEPSLLVRLLNPLTRQLTDLPPVTGLLRPEQRWHRMCLGEELGSNLEVNAAGLVADASASAVAVSFCNPTVLAIAKPGDESWTVVTKDRHIIRSTALPFAGRFYCATGRGVMELDISSFSDQKKPPQLVMVAKQRSSFYFNSMRDSLHLIDNGGELMLVHRMLCRDNAYAGDYSRKYEVHRVDLDAGILVPVNKGFNGRALFMGTRRAISVSTEVFPSVTADSLYVGFDHGVKTTTMMDGYSVADGRSKPHRYDPCTIVGCLSYCIQRTCKQF